MWTVRARNWPTAQSLWHARGVPYLKAALEQHRLPDRKPFQRMLCSALTNSLSPSRLTAEGNSRKWFLHCGLCSSKRSGPTTPRLRSLMARVYMRMQGCWALGPRAAHVPGAAGIIQAEMLAEATLQFQALMLVRAVAVEAVLMKV